MKLTPLALLALLPVISGSSRPTEPTGKLTVRVTDAETRLPLPSRLALKASDGTYPGDRLAGSARQWPNLEMHGVFIPGEETFELPVGETTVTAAHGLEYVAETKTVRVAPGRTAVLELPLQRVFDMRKAGWVAGDLHVHMIHGEQQRKTSYEDIALTCSANGLDFVSVCQEMVGAGRLTLAGLQAECEKVSNERFKMLLGAERPQSLLGHNVMLGVPNPFIVDEDPPYYQAARKARKQGGATVYVHPLRYYPGKQYQGQWLDFPGNNLGREIIYDAFCGPSFDGLSVLSDEPDDPQAFALWFTLLNRGLFVPVLADSDACFDRPVFGMKAPGFWNTYYYIGPGGKVDGATLAEALRSGRTMATTGPLLQFKIDGQISGSTLKPDGKPHKVQIQAWLPQHAFTLEKSDSRSGRPQGISRVELIRNGVVVKTWEPHAPSVTLTETVTESASCWYVVRVFGEDRKWQVGVTSPVYFAVQPVPTKRAPFETLVRGRIYDFKTGVERAGTVEIRRDDEILKSFPARGTFQVKMPLDAEITVRAEGFRPERRTLLMDYGPIHRFLWYLESKDLANSETLNRFEKIAQTVDLEFPLGYKMPGSYIAADLAQPADLAGIKILDGPPQETTGTTTVAAVLVDTDRISPGDTLHVAVLYRDEGNTSKLGPLVVEGRGYDPSRPSTFEELKKFGEFEKRWETAVDLGNGYRLVSGSLTVPKWVEPGPTGGVDISVRARQGNGDASYLGLLVPLGPTHRALSLSTAWPTLPVSWQDRNYGIGPFKLCNRIGRAAQPRADYRKLHLELTAGGRRYDLLPARDGRGCPDADDAVYTEQYLDQVLANESKLAAPDAIRAQPTITWPKQK